MIRYLINKTDPYQQEDDQMFGDWHVCRRPCHIDYDEETGNTNYWVLMCNS